MLAWPVLDGWDGMWLMKLVLQAWKSSQLGLNAAVGKNCPQGAETVPGEQEAERARLFFSVHPCPSGVLVAEPSTGGKAGPMEE